MIYPWTPSCAPGAWTQAPIFAWLASVSIVPVLQSDHLTGKVRLPTVDGLKDGH